MTIEQQVDAILDPMIETVFNTQQKEYSDVDPALRDRWYYGKLDSTETSVNLRFDFEIPDDDPYDLIKVLTNGFKKDFIDLLVNGDVEQSVDVLLKAFDGAKKRGHDPKEIKIIGASLYTEKRKRNDVWNTEYTLYVRPYIKWPT